SSSFELNVVFANWPKDVQYLAIRNGATGMHSIRWNYAYGPRSKYQLDPVHDNFEFTLESVSNLFVRMRMFGQDGSGGNVPIHERHGCRSDKFSSPPWKWRLH